MSKWKMKDNYMICPVCNSMFFKEIPTPKECPRCLVELEEQSTDIEIITTGKEEMVVTVIGHTPISHITLDFKIE